MKSIKWYQVLSAAILVGCGTSEIKPVDIFAEDACSQCKMAFSDHGFASEIIAQDGLVYKFDDIGCMDKFRKDNHDVQAVRVFYKDFDTRQWRAENTSIIVRTGIKTPMGSGKIAVADSSRANAMAEQYPPEKDVSENSSGCGAGCCSSKEN